MPLVSTESASQYWEPVARGPRAQLDMSAIAPATILAGGNFSLLINGDGYGAISAAVTSTQAGALTLQRWLDVAGTIPVAAVSSLTLPAATVLTLGIAGTADDLPYRSFTVKITNTSGSTATISGFALLLIAQ